MSAYLFVYGSLMSAARHPMGERLRREARLVGEATLQGRLYRISWYPGAVESDESGQRVHGEVYALDDPDRALAWLDEYESIVPDSPSEYERLERPARLASGEAITAWVYLYRGDVAGFGAIPDGRWAADTR